jgi:hypothetical protein
VVAAVVVVVAHLPASFLLVVALAGPVALAVVADLRPGNFPPTCGLARAPAVHVRRQLASFPPVPAAATALVEGWVVLAASVEWAASAAWVVLAAWVESEA